MLKKMKKFFAILLVVLLCGSFVNNVGIMGLCEVEAAGFEGGSGTKSDPYLVKTASQLKLVEKYNGCYFKQIANIDLKNKSFKPLFSVEKPFKGYYDGNKKTISNLKISNRAVGGLFMAIGEKGTVKNLYVKNVKITGVTSVKSDDVHYGAIVGYNQGMIRSCKATNIKVNAVNSADVGGICGQMNGGTIRNCVASKLVFYGCDLGGICGGATDAVITNCKASKMELHSAGFSSTDGYLSGAPAGIVGASSNSIIEECKVSGKCQFEGGGYSGNIVAYDNNNMVIDCESDILID